MGVVDFPRDAAGRIIVDPSAVASAENAAPPAAPRRVRALDPGAHMSIGLPGAGAAATPAADEPRLPSLTRPQLAVAAVAAALLALALIAFVVRATDARDARPLVQPTAPAPTAPPTLVPTLAPTAPPLPVLAWQVDAFDGNGQYVGPLGAGRPYTVTGAIDREWLAVEAPAWNGAPASGPIRIRAVDLVTQPLAYGPTATPALPPQPVYVYVEVPAAPAPALATVAPATPMPAQRSQNQVGGRPNLNPGPRYRGCAGSVQPEQCDEATP